MSDIGQMLIDAVNRVADLTPNYVYQKPPKDTPIDYGTCRYVYNGKPSCLIGVAAWDIGLISSEFEKCSQNFGGVDELCNMLGLNLDEDEEQYLMQVQDLQDQGINWGDAARLLGGE